MMKTIRLAPGWKQRVRKEFIEYWITVLYLALYFGAFVVYRRLILAKHEIEYLNYGIALVQAMVLGKVIMIGELMRLGRAGKDRPLIIPTLMNSTIFTAWVAVFSVLEHIAKALLQGHGAAAGLREFVQLGSHELLASSVVVFFTFIPFFAFKELERAIGKGALWNLFFGMRAAKST